MVTDYSSIFSCPVDGVFSYDDYAAPAVQLNPPGGEMIYLNATTADVDPSLNATTQDTGTAT